MPETSLRPRRPVRTLDDAVAVLREDGGRVTAARRTIIGLLLASPDPTSAEDLAGRASPPLDLPSTYRNLERLEELGLVRHVHFGHGPGLYELISDSEHEYALCESCGAVKAVATEELDQARAAIESAIGYRARFTHLPLVGICANCRDD